MNMATPRLHAPIIRSIEHLQEWFVETKNPYLCMNLSPIHMIGLEKFVPSLKFMSPTDYTDGSLPGLLKPMTDRGAIPPFLAGWMHRTEVIRLVKEHCKGAGVAFLFFIGETESAAERLGLKVMFPPSQIRDSVGTKTNGNRIAEEAGVKPAPYVLGKVESYKQLRRMTLEAGLGDALVVQIEYSDSGLGTYHISSEADYDKYAAAIEYSKECRIMRKLDDPRSVTIEAVVGREEGQDVVGMPMLDHVGFPELTPLANAWCGNEVGRGILPDGTVRQIREETKRICQVLRKHSYWGTVCIDFLLVKSDEGTFSVYFGEINSRLSGATPLSTVTSAAALGVPLLLFHLAAFENLQFDLAFDTLHEQIGNSEVGNYSSLIIKHLDEQALRCITAPQSGIYQLKDGLPAFQRSSADISSLADNEAFWIREVRAGVENGDVLYPATIMGRLFFPRRVTDDKGELTQHALQWTAAVRAAHTLRDYREVA
jgi:hypothetical protein